MKITEKGHNFIKDAVNAILDGSLEKARLITALNSLFKEMYLAGLIDRLVKVSTCRGIPRFKHEMSVSTFRSGLMFEVQNDDDLSKAELQDFAFVIFGFPPMVRQLKLLGFDTLIMKGKNTKSLYYRITEGTGILDNEAPHPITANPGFHPQIAQDNPPGTVTKKQNTKARNAKDLIFGLLVILIVLLIITIKIINGSVITPRSTVDSVKANNPIVDSAKSTYDTSPTFNTRKRVKHTSSHRPETGDNVWNDFFCCTGEYDSKDYQNHVDTTNGIALLGFTNDLKIAAVVSIVNYDTNIVLRNIYIRPKQKFGVFIPVGKYYLRVCVGRHWDNTVFNSVCYGSFANPIYYLLPRYLDLSRDDTKEISITKLIRSSHTITSSDFFFCKK